LSKAEKPIVLYGMGDGADKILNSCKEKNITISGVFASDGFASGKLFHTFNVISYSEMCKRFDDFIVLLSFATQRKEVLDNIYKIAFERELYCPDVPVFGNGLFDSSFVHNHINEFENIYNLLSDDLSRQAYINVILGKLTGKIGYLKNCETNVAEAYASIIKPDSSFHYVDIGAYNGDTIREFLLFSGGSTKKITAFEPDLKNYNKLICFANEAGIDTSSFHNVACWNKEEVLQFYSRSGRNSAKTSNHENAKTTLINALKADTCITEKPDFINIDAEGSDALVIEGLSETINKYKPTLSCALYHRNEDMFKIPQLLFEKYGECEMYIRHFPYLPAWDTNVYAKPKINK